MGASRHRLTRRAFLGASAAAPALAKGVRLDFRPLRPRAPLLPERDVSTFCELCFWNCGVIARARKNRVLELMGHPDHPHAQGKLCGRGQAGAAFLRDADRLQYPLIRVGERGEGKFKRVGWKTALQTVAQAFARIKAAHGAEALALIYHGSGGAFLRQFFAAYGSPNAAGPSYAQCRGPRDVGFHLTFGEKLGSPEPLDFERTKAMVLFGSHLGENAHNSQVQAFVKARRRGASLVVLDPRLSTVASKADVWLPVKPGSDLAVMLAWMHLAIAEHAYDADFVSRFTVGFEDLKAHVADKTPEWAAKQAEVPAADIRRAWERIRAAGPAVIFHPGRHATWYGEADTQRARGQAILTAILGAFWAPGGLLRPERATIPPFPWPPAAPLPKDVDKASGRFPLATELTTTGLRDATLTGKPTPIKAWYVHGSNLIQSLPDVAATEEALKKLDFVVVSDVQPTEITRWADVILPEDLYLERYDDLQTAGTVEPFVALRQPVVQSPFDTRPAWRIAKDLAKELGIGDAFPFETFEDYLEARLTGTGIALADLKAQGVVKRPRKTAPYLDRAEGYAFHTPSGKVELFSETMKAQGFDPLPVYQPQPDAPAGTFRLLYGRSPLHTFGRTQNNPILHDLEPSNDLWMHPADAAALGLKDGQSVRMRSPKGRTSGPLPLHVTERIPTGVVYTVHGFGQRSKGLKRAFAMGGSDTEVMDGYRLDPISGSTGMRGNFVTIEGV